MGVIYKITSPNNRLYVGQTYDLRKRINAHKCAAKQGKNIILHNSIRKYGWDAHVLEILEEIDDALLDEREIFWIDELRTYCYENPDGMNMTKGGLGHRSTWMHDIERRKKQSERMKGAGGTFYGKKHTIEAKQKMSECAKKISLETGRRVPEWGAEKGREAVRKKVACYDKNGVLKSKHRSVSDAADFYSVNHGVVSTNCLGKTTCVNGEYIFRHFDVDPEEKISVGELKSQSVKRPVLFLNSDFEVMGEFPSSQEASDFFGIPKTTINRAAMYNWLVPIRSGHIFIYTDLYQSILESEQIPEVGEAIKP